MEPVADILHQINWVDVGYLILFVRIGYIAFKTGFIVEASKLCGTLVAIYISFHYYTALGDAVRPFVNIEGIPLQFLDYFCLLFLALCAYATSIVLREGLSRLLKLEAVPLLHKWGGLAVAAARAILLASLLSYTLWVSTISYLHTTVGGAYFGPMFLKAAPAVYKAIWETTLSRFMRHEKYNETVNEVMAELQP